METVYKTKTEVLAAWKQNRLSLMKAVQALYRLGLSIEESWFIVEHT